MGKRVRWKMASRAIWNGDRVGVYPVGKLLGIISKNRGFAFLTW